MSLPEIPAGTWKADPSHSDIGFTVRHLAVSRVRGLFETFDVTIDIAPNVLDSSVMAEIDLASIDTRDAQRDEHLRSTDFFSVEEHPTMTYRSTSVKADGSDYLVSGDLTIGDVTRSVDLDLEFNGVGPDPWGGTRIGFAATTEFSRKDFGIDFNIPLDGGGVVIGDKIRVSLEIEAVLQQDEAADGS